MTSVQWRHCADIFIGATSSLISVPEAQSGPGADSGSQEKQQHRGYRSQAAVMHCLAEKVYYLRQKLGIFV